MIIRARAPLRLGLAGGGTDVTPYCDTYGGLVLNATIDRYAYATITTLDDPVIRFVSADQGVSMEFALDDELRLNGQLDLFKAAYTKIINEYNDGTRIALELVTFCDAPAGSGLGSSSTLVVAMVSALSELLGLPLDDYSIAALAYRIERVDCQLKGGRQDQYSATFGGVNFMEFYENDKVIVNSLRVRNWIMCELEASLVLFYTGVSRESANIILDQTKNLQTSNQIALEAFHSIKQEAISMKENLLVGKFDGIVDSMRKGWDNKKRSASSVSNSRIEGIYDAAIDAGARAGKVSGAGGGGFMMFFVSPEKRMDVIKTLQQYEGQVSNAHFTSHGSQAWRIG